MKLWQKDYTVDQEIDRFTVGRDRELDLELARYDIQGSLAHIEMLTSIGLIEKEELPQLAAALKAIYQEVLAGKFTIEDGIEDVHSQVEMLLTERLGEMGKKIHSGRSRNDQVLVDLRLYFRAEMAAIAEGISELFQTLQSLSQQYQHRLMPGYTHLQVGMVSSFGLWFGAYAESLTDDLQLLQSVFKINNQNPLGSAAGYGSSFPLNRKLTTELLAFDDLNYNVVHAQLGRGKTEHFLAFALAGIGHTLGKLAMDTVLFMNQNFGFISFPDELTTGSSIMPHKKNPDVFELIRGRCNQLQSLPAQVSQLTGNLPGGYHRDFQLLKEMIFPAIESLKDSLAIASYALQQIRIKDNILDDDKYIYLYSVEEVNRLVLSGMPFRDAYKEVGRQIESGDFNPPREVQHTHEGSIGNLNHREVNAKWERIWAGFGFAEIEDKISQLVS
ncbi:argininosuccinate lyase [Flavilitoribacter nigricans]|uniref:Argininosuccinate lyase n=1 Tax=Flavilitoribacter nigricans (strain ATCC 23147 / DSM 23189 / NBRC 102662 / NCIMB 1420 / SS-2) TaxID=1122177 RepID=A0A2D0NB87_FLAN2|nr:argininosuccinate lyase [Flavilitoribacter nigricans]PHN05656.1 argininosuccinate lyase [Flavilitoribacter nigricans DSM 23189 = NBRC 102662]